MARNTPLDLKKNTTMCIDTIERARYIGKGKIISECDSYELKSDYDHLFPAVTYPDIVNYMLHSPSPYIFEDLKS